MSDPKSNLPLTYETLHDRPRPTLFRGAATFCAAQIIAGIAAIAVFMFTQVVDYGLIVVFGLIQFILFAFSFAVLSAALLIWARRRPIVSRGSVLAAGIVGAVYGPIPWLAISLQQEFDDSKLLGVTLWAIVFAAPALLPWLMLEKEQDPSWD